MSILPNNTDPLMDYVNGYGFPPLTQNGIVYNKVYAQTGVIDTLDTTNRTGYVDPNLNIINGSNNLIAFDQIAETYWLSSQQYGGSNSAPVVLTYNFARPTYFNIIKFFVLNVPCYIQLLDQNGNALPGDSTFINPGGNDIFTTTDWVALEYVAPYTIQESSISISITRNQNVQILSNGAYVYTPYAVGLKAVSIRLQILENTDVPGAVVSGTTSIVTQNRFNFIENYAYNSNQVVNVFGNDTAYWKCAPQPTGDSIVYFYAKVNDPIPTSINRFYIDPLYSSCRFNVYYTTQTINPALITGNSSNFETGLGGWSSANSYWTASQDSTYSHSGTYSLKATRVSATNAAAVGYVFNAPTTLAQYTFSFYVLGDATSIGKSYRVAFKDQSYATFAGQNFFVTGSWQQVTLTATIPTNVTKINIYINDDPQSPSFTNGASIWIDDVTLNTGSSVGQIDPGTLSWTPIQRDFTLRKGIYDLPTVSATYLKFEFTKLNPEAYDLPVDSVTRTINVFPADVETYYTDLENSVIDGNSVKYAFIGNNNNPQTISNTSLSSSTLFGLSSNTVANSNSWPSLSALNNSQLNGNTTTVGINTNSYITDPTISYKLIDVNGNYNGVAYTQYLQRRFYNTRVHNYTQITLNQSWHEAYFVGVQYITAFYEQQYDDIRSTPSNLYANNNTTSGFYSYGTNYISLNPDDIATTQWYNTLDQFNSFNIGAIMSDWNSFLTDNQVLMIDSSVLSAANQSNATISANGYFGKSRIIQVKQSNPGIPYSIRSSSYPISNNELTYTDANYITTSKWTGVSGTTLTKAPIVWASGTASGLIVSGGSYTAAYNFTIPGVYNASGTVPWQLQFGLPSFGVVGYGEYNPTTSGTNFYFYTGVTVTGTGGVPSISNTITSKVQYVNPNTNTVTGTVTSGTTTAFTSGSGSAYSYVIANDTTVSGYPSNTVQFVISGTNPYNLYQLGLFPSQTTSWITPQDRNNMRISGATRLFLPFSSNGTYRVSLFATSSLGVLTEIAFKNFVPGEIPINTWVEIQLELFTGDNYSGFYVQVQQVNGYINEVFYVSMLSPFYHPIRFEYTTISGSTYPNNYQPITGPINSPDYFVTAASPTSNGILSASGIQLRMTGLDPNVFISGVSVVPYTKGSPYYAELDVDYIGSSKTNETSVRRVVGNKPYLQGGSSIYPIRFNVENVVGPSTNYITA